MKTLEQAIKLFSLWDYDCREVEVLDGNGTDLVAAGDDGSWEIGYHIAKQFTEHGYATEAVKAFLPAMAQKLNIKEVYGICLVENTASVRVLEKCGFVQVYQGTGNYQGNEAEILKTIISADIM